MFVNLAQKNVPREIIRVMVAAALVGLFVVFPLTEASAIPSAPAQTFSFYVSTVNQTTMYNLGVSFGEDTASGVFPQSSLVVLDFGVGDYSGSTYGTVLPLGCGCFESDAADVAATEQFAYGYWIGVGSDTTAYTSVAMGTNNSAGTWFDNTTNDSNFGKNWANEVNNANTYLSGKYASGQVEVNGGIDAELGTGYSAYKYAEAWATGYELTAEYLYWDYGSADGCPPYGSCDGGWTQTDVYNMAWGNTSAEPLPQIYNDANAQEWAEIVDDVGDISFLGPMDQHQACADEGYSCSGTDNTSDDAWDDLYNALNCSSGCPDPQTPLFVTNIRQDLAE